eukprot:2473375-Amphidinium_carterae.2
MARVVLGAATLDLILMMLLLLPVNLLALALCYDPAWPSTMGDSTSTAARTSRCNYLLSFRIQLHN